MNDHNIGPTDPNFPESDFTKIAGEIDPEWLVKQLLNNLHQDTLREILLPKEVKLFCANSLRLWVEINDAYSWTEYHLWLIGYRPKTEEEIEEYKEQIRKAKEAALKTEAEKKRKLERKQKKRRDSILKEIQKDSQLAKILKEALNVKS